MCKDKKGIEERIFQIAAKLFAEYGFHKTTLRDITNAVKCNGAAVNYHFHSKENLYILVIRNYIKILTDDWCSEIQGAFTKKKKAITIESFLRTVTMYFLRYFTVPENGQLLIKLILHEYQYPFLPKQILFRELIEPIQSIMIMHFKFLCPYLTNETAQQCVDSYFAQLTFVFYKNILFTRDKEVKMPNSELDKTFEHITSFTLAGIRNYEGI